MLTRQRDFSDLDGRATDQRAASRSQNVRLVDLAGGRGGRGDGRGGAGGRRARHDRRGSAGYVVAAVGRRGRYRGGRHHDRLSVSNLDLAGGHLSVCVAGGSILRDLLLRRLDAETGERAGARGAQTEAHLRQKIALGAGFLQ